MTAGSDAIGAEKASIDLRDGRPAGPAELDRQVRALLAEDPVAVSHERALQAHRLAREMAARGLVDDAVALYRRSIVIKQEVLGPSHPEVATTLHNLALLLEAAGRTDEARTAWSQARAVLESVVRSESAP